jgi:hypothetical protein
MEAPIAAPAQEEASQISALRENCERKGKNSYYYAHDRVINGPQVSFKKLKITFLEIPAVKLHGATWCACRCTTLKRSTSINRASHLCDPEDAHVYNREF